MASKQHHLWCFLSIFASFCWLTLACYDDELYVIRSRAFTGLVLDASDPLAIRIQFFTNASSQLWKFEIGTTAGLFYISNNKTGKVLDIRPTEDTLALVLDEKRNISRQQWSLRLDGRIVNSENQRNIDIKKAKFLPGTQVIVWGNNGNQAQDFVWEKFEDDVLQEQNEDSPQVIVN